NEVSLSFCIWGFECTPEELTTRIGLEPTLIRKKNKPIRPNSGIIPERNGWILEAPILKQNKYATFEEQAVSLFSLLGSKRDILKPICDESYVELSIALYINTDTGESTPWVHFTKGQNHLISYLNA